MAASLVDSVARDFVPEENALYPFIHKRRSFENEKEIRAVASNLWGINHKERVKETDPSVDGAPDGTDGIAVPPAVQGLVLPADLAELVVRVHVSPVSPSWFTELVTSVIAKYGVELEVVQSDIDGEPVC